MAEKIAKLKKGAGPVEVEIFIGQAQWGSYNLDLWDAEGLNPESVGAGLNTDNIPDKFPLPAVSTLNGKMLSWEVRVQAFVDGPGQLYSVVVKIRQNGIEIPGGPPPKEGAFDGAIVVYDFVRFLVI